MFVFRKVIFEKLFSKLSCICLPLEKSINGKHFPVNGKYFLVKEKFGMVSRKVFSLLAVFVFQKVISGKPLSKLSCVCLPLKKLVNGKHLQSKKNLAWFSGKYFSEKFERKTLSGSCEKF